MAVQYLRARLGNQPLPEVQLDAPAAAPDAQHAGRIEPDAAKAAELLDAVLPGSPATPLPGGLRTPHPLWLVECGNFTYKDLPFPGLRARTHLEALAQMGAVAAIPGSAELQLTQAQAAEFFRDSPLPLVSCNLKLSGEGFTVAPYLKLAPGWYLTGVTAAPAAPGSASKQEWWELTDPREGVKQVQKKLPLGAQLIVVALHQPEAALSGLARTDSLLVSEDAWPIVFQQWIPAPPAKAQYVQLATFSLGEGTEVALTRWQLELSDYWPDDPAIPPLFKAEYKAIRERILGVRANAGGKNNWKQTDWGISNKYLPPKDGAAADVSSAGGAPDAGQLAAVAYVGAQSCQPCHAQAYATWQQSRHYHALESLLPQQDNENLDCLKCHATALLQPGGYDPYTPNAVLGRVSCENCHGPGTEHVALMSGGKVPPAPVRAGLDPPSPALRIRRGSLSDCVSCHDKYNSPKFEPQEYWERVKH